MKARTSVDWLSFRTQGELPEVVNALQGVYGPIGGIVKLSQRPRGWQGYKSSADILLGDMEAGLLAFGGDNQKGWVHVSLSGTGCQWVQDWDTAQEEIQALPAVSIRRCDIALDTVGKDVSHESVLQAYRAGQFSTFGRPPKCQRIESERPEDGRTIYIGSRENDKFFRGYEKGLQLAAKIPTMNVTHIGGAPVGDMYRCEVELKAKSGALPDDLIDRRDQYFTGCYPYLQHVLNDIEPEVMVIDRSLGPRMSLDRALEHIRQQYGSTLFTALTVHHGDIGEVWSRICGKQHNQELLKAGVLLVEH